MERVRVMIHGRVQGVFFRANTQREATGLGLSGWVRNTPDGCVEAAACGDRSRLEAFVAWCRRGPEKALVQRVDVSWESCDEASDGFHIRY